MKIRLSEIRKIIREEIEGLDSEVSTKKYDDEMGKAGFSKKQAKKLPDELQAGILKKRLKREGG
jgi:hypothetical protein